MNTISSHMYLLLTEIHQKRGNLKVDDYNKWLEGGKLKTKLSTLKSKEYITVENDVISITGTGISAIYKYETYN